MDKRKKWLWIIAYTVLGIMAALSLVQGCRNGAMYSQDFQWDAAKALTMKVNPYVESIEPTGILESYGYEEYFSQMEANQFPSLLWLLFPFTLLSPMGARYVWLIGNLLLTGGIGILLKKTYFKKADNKIYMLLFLLMLAGTPWRNQIGVGQHTIFSFFFFLLAVWIAEKNVERKNILLFLGVVVSLTICFFKYTLTAPLALYFIYKRWYQPLWTAIIIHGILTVFSAYWLGESIVQMIIQPLKVSSALASEGGIDLGAALGGSSLSFLIGGLAFLLLYGMMIGIRQGEDEDVISMLVLWSLIITYHRTYDFFVLILPASMFFRGEKENSQYPLWLLSYYFILLITVFFVLRIFHEGDGVLLITGVGYYIFTIYIMGMNFRKMKKTFKTPKKA